jgi:hypothetical protein
VHRTISFLLLLLAPIFYACKQPGNRNEANNGLASINLKKGDIILCGPPEAQFGTVEFNLSCSEEVKKDFNLATALLHSFEYDEAEKVFAKVIDKDPECAMAYWGVAMSNWHPLWDQPNRAELEKGSKALAIARNLKKKSERESDYLEAIGMFYENWQEAEHKSRALAFEKAMDGIYRKYPADKEAAIFYALALNATANPEDKTYANQKKAVAILNSIKAGGPDHPGIAHYIIHNYDYPELAELALPTARRYAAIAPSSAHAQHMPSHIFTRLGLWKESIASDLASIDAAKCYAEGAGIKGHWDEELHGLDYVVYAYLQEGKDEEAKKLVEYIKTIDQVYPINFKGAYAFAAIPSRYALELRLWKDAANLETQPSNFPMERFPWQKAIIHFTRIIGAIHIGDSRAAKNDFVKLNELHDVLLKARDEYKARQVLIQVKAADAWIRFHEGKKEEGLKLMVESAELEDRTEKHPVTPGEIVPARELLGDLLILSNAPAKALQAYELSLKTHPNRLNALFGAGLAAKKSGDMSKASFYFGKVLENTASSKSKRASLEEASLFLAQK